MVYHFSLLFIKLKNFDTFQPKITTFLHTYIYIKSNTRILFFDDSFGSFTISTYRNLTEIQMFKNININMNKIKFSKDILLNENINFFKYFTLR